MTPLAGSTILFALVATIGGPTAGLADDLVSSKVVVGEATLDLDKDGKPDHVVLAQDGPNASVDLYIDFGVGDDKLAVSRRPTIFKKGIGGGAAESIESGQNGGLTIRSGCGGCSNDTTTEVKLVYRNGIVLVGGFTLDWDTRSGIGRCVVDLLTGKSFVGHGLGNTGKPIKVRSGPIALSAWSDDTIAKICP